jgi:2-methylcitrate dehydratase PrpD
MEETAQAHGRSSVTSDVASYVSRCSFDGLPETAVHQAKRLLLDGISWMCLGARKREAAGICGLATGSKADDSCTIVGTPHQAPCGDAVFANAAHAQVHDCNDGWSTVKEGGSYHAGRVVIPVALTLGEHGSIPGQDLLSAIVTGYEVAARVRSCSRRSASDLYGAAAAASKILKLSEHRIPHALALADLHGPLVLPGPEDFDTDANYLSNGYIARAGVEAAFQAREGFRAPLSTEHVERVGSFPCQSRETEYAILTTYIKPYPTCRYCHAATDVALEYRQERQFSVPTIKAVRVRIGGGDYVTRRAGPDTYFKTCQFSLPYAMACALLDGQVAEEQFTAERIARRDVQELQHRISVTVDEALSEGGPRHLAHVVVESVDGSEFARQVVFPRGAPQNALSDEELQEKFRKWVGATFKESTKEQIIQQVFRVEELDSVADLTSLLIRQPQ